MLHLFYANMNPPMFHAFYFHFCGCAIGKIMKGAEIPLCIGYGRVGWGLGVQLSDSRRSYANVEQNNNTF